MIAENRGIANHPSRKKPSAPGTPSPDEVREARERAGLTPEQAAALIWYYPEHYAEFEAGTRRMHPVVWWSFKKRLAGET